MSHWVIAPVVLTSLLAAAMVLVMRHHLGLQRIFSVAGIAALVAIALGQAWQAAQGAITVYRLGDWPAPFGIVLVADRLSTLMVLLTALLALVVMLYAIGSGWDRRGRHFHPLFQFQLLGITGAFLTGDAFNLFVFFEVLLIASYGLMIHSGGTRRLRAGVQYVAYNLLGSTLFLFALATIYGVTGTLNMADIAVRVAALPAEDTALIRVGATLLLLVFAVKGALLPLHFWLPASYGEAPPPVAALFAVMTKVGAYAILRMFTLAFPPELAHTAGHFQLLLMPAALLTLVVGSVGILGATRLERLAAFAAIASMGTLFVAISLFTREGTVAALYYMVHSTFASAAMFLVVDLVARGRGTEGAPIAPGPPLPRHGLVACLYFAAAVALAGMPPLSGFLGKLLVLDAARTHLHAGWIWGTILVASLVTLAGLSRAGITIFWQTLPAAATPQPPLPALACAATGSLLAALVLATVFAGPLSTYFAATADQLFAPENYIRAVLGEVP